MNNESIRSMSTSDILAAKRKIRWIWRKLPNGIIGSGTIHFAEYTLLSEELQRRLNQ